MVGTRKITVVSYKELSDSDSDAYEHKHSAGLKRRRGGKQSKKSHKKRVAPAGVALANSKPPWTVLPLDVVHEIFRWLEPLDLLQLARTTRTLRSHLMSKVSSSLWKSTRENVIGGTPECPEYMSEPAFARLLFMNECFVCGKIETSPEECRIYWNIQMRCCGEGFVGRNFSIKGYLDKEFRKVKNASLVAELLPYASGQYLFAPRRYYVPALRKMMADIKNYENLIIAQTPRAEEDFEAFKTTQKNHVAAMRKGARIYGHWHITYKRLRDQQLRAERKAVLTAKLLAEGHDHLGDIHSAFRAYDKAEKLSEDGWIAIRDHAVKAVVQYKRDRRKTLLNHRRSVAVAVLMGEANINEDLIVDREDDEEATAKDFHDTLNCVEEWVEEWKTERRLRMLQIMVSAGAAAIADPPTEQDSARLKLATTMFSCTTPFPRRSSEQTRGGLMCFTLLERHFRRCHTGGFPWNTTCLKYSNEAEEMIRYLVVVVGRDPETTTADQMDDLNARFYCQGCPKWEKLARSWRNCAAHFEDHPLDMFQGWLVVSPADTIKIIHREISNTADAGNRLQCSHHEFDGYDSPSSFWDHFRSAHSEEFNLGDVIINPLVPPQPISLDGEISQPAPPLNPTPKPSHL
ncbi:hypothetical protein FRB94_009174 [Tulasnella sp. JGI-2019a]|nr:hypothetical protein FRB94_009174 [Tulasnella sp. JGI-2019a]